MGLLIVIVPVVGGAVYQAHTVAVQRTTLARELADARAMAREVVDELVKAKGNLEASEAQVENLLEATTMADHEARELRRELTDWQERHESLASAARRRIEDLSVRSAATEQRLEYEKTLRESERARLEDSLYAVSNQLAATDTELRDTQDFAREAAQRTEHLERGVFALRNKNDSLSSTLSDVQSNLYSAQIDASSARSEASTAWSEASSAESERDHARHALSHAEGVIGSLKSVVAHQRREEVREHQELVRPPVVQARPQVAAAPRPREPPRAPPGGPPERREPPGGRRPR